MYYSRSEPASEWNCIRRRTLNKENNVIKLLIIVMPLQVNWTSNAKKRWNAHVNKEQKLRQKKLVITLHSIGILKLSFFLCQATMACTYICICEICWLICCLIRLIRDKIRSTCKRINKIISQDKQYSQSYNFVIFQKHTPRNVIKFLSIYWHSASCSSSVRVNCQVKGGDYRWTLPSVQEEELE